ncbi:MATE family efflux transporter [Leadbetterella byssophila]|uniref:MATE family efflux transporter n=1 Tax=Leadbetterella byssophila TaxID=316068 RepID=UPI00399F6AF3
MYQKSFKFELFKTYKLALPIIISQLGVILMATSDNVIVGRLLGPLSLGAAGIANSIAFLISSIAVGGMAVIAPMVSKLIAEQKQGELARLYFNSLIVALIFSGLLTAIGIVVYYNFSILGQTADIERLGAPFFIFIILSNVPMIFFLAVKQFTDGFSKPSIVMYITLLGLVFDILGNMILITGWWIFPELGLNGAAIGTIFSRILMFSILLYYTKSKEIFATLFDKTHWEWDTKLIKVILERSVPAGFQSFFEIAAFSFAVIMMGWLSETDLAAHQIAINVASTTYMMATGFAHAGSIRIGEAWGNKDRHGIQLAGKAAYTWVLAFMGTCAIIIILFGNNIIHLYIEDVEVLKAALPLLTIAAFFQLSDGAQAVGLGVLRGLADIKIPTYITFLAYWLIALPAGYIFGFPLNRGAQGIWYGLLLGLTFSALFLYARYRNVSKRSVL